MLSSTFEKKNQENGFKDISMFNEISKKLLAGELFKIDPAKIENYLKFLANNQNSNNFISSNENLKQFSTSSINQNPKLYSTIQTQPQIPLKNSNSENLNNNVNTLRLINQLNSISQNSFKYLPKCQTINPSNNFQSSFFDKQQQHIYYQQQIAKILNDNQLSNNNLSFMPQQSSSINAPQSFLTNNSLINNLQQPNFLITNNQPIIFNYFSQDLNLKLNQNFLNLSNYFNMLSVPFNNLTTPESAENLAHSLKNNQSDKLIHSNMSQNNLIDLNYNPQINDSDSLRFLLNYFTQNYTQNNSILTHESNPSFIQPSINCCQNAATSQLKYNKLIKTMELSNSIQKTSQNDHLVPKPITNKKLHHSFDIADLVNINDSTNNNLINVYKLNNNNSSTELNQNLLIKAPICKNEKNFAQKLDKVSFIANNKNKKFESYKMPQLLPETILLNTIDDENAVMPPQLNAFDESLEDNNFILKKKMELNSVSKKQHNFSIDSLSRSSSSKSSGSSPLTTLQNNSLNVENLIKNSLTSTTNSMFIQQSSNQIPLFLATSQFFSSSTIFPTPPISTYSSTESENQFSPTFMYTSINQENLLPKSENRNSKSCKNVASQNFTNENFNSIQIQPVIHNNAEDMVLNENNDLLTKKKINDTSMNDEQRALSLKLKLKNFAKIKKTDSPKETPISLPITNYFSPILTNESCKKVIKSKKKFIEINKKKLKSKSYRNEFTLKVKTDFDKKESKKKKLTFESNYKLRKNNFYLQKNTKSNRFFSCYSEFDNQMLNNEIFFDSFDVQDSSKKQNSRKNISLKNSDVKLSDFISSSTIKSNWRPISDGSYKQVQCFNDVKTVQRLCFQEIRHYSQHYEVIRVNDCVKIFSFEGRENIGKVLHLFYDKKKKTIMVTLLWFYTHEQAKIFKNYKNLDVQDNELFASMHIDTVNADCIEGLAFVLTYNEYCRFVTESMIDQLPPHKRPIESEELWSRGEENYSRRLLLPHEDTHQEMVYFCRAIYNIQTKTISSLKSIVCRKTKYLSSKKKDIKKYNPRFNRITKSKFRK